MVVRLGDGKGGQFGNSSMRFASAARRTGSSLVNSRSHVAFLLLLPRLAACGIPQGPPDGQPGADLAIALTPYFRDLRTVTATLGGDPLTLLFDTGGGATLITPALARRLGCLPSGRDVGFRMDGERVAFQRCDSLTLSVSGWPRRFRPIAVFDVNALLPAELPRLDGVLALDAFRGQVLTLDWPGQRLVVHSAGTSESALRGAGVPVRVATGESGRFFSVFAPVAGRLGLLWFLIDSGNIRGTLVDREVQRDSLLFTGSDSTVALQVGPRAAVPTAVQYATLILDGVLGTAFLQRGPLTIDLRRFQP